MMECPASEWMEAAQAFVFVVKQLGLPTTLAGMAIAGVWQLLAIWRAKVENRN